MYVPVSKGPGGGWTSFTPAQVLVLGFGAVIMLGAILLTLPAAQADPTQPIGFLDALFTATSAVCVTGLVVVDTATQFSTFGEVVIMLLIQAGGLGIMTLSALIFLLMGRRISLSERLVMQEALGSFSIAGVVRLTRAIILTTLAIEAVGALLLTLRFSQSMDWATAAYWGVFHSISAFNNAGFDLTSNSLIPFGFDPFVLLVIALLFVVGGIGFFVLEDVWRRRSWDRFSLHTRLALRITGWLIALGTVMVLLLEFNNPQTLGEMPFFHKVTNAIFTAVTPRTAGFNSVPVGGLLDATLLFMVMLMFIGASPSGTGGGIKTTTFGAIALVVKATALGREEVKIMGRRLPADLIFKSLTVAAIALFWVITVTGILLVTESKAIADPTSPITFVDIMFEATSAFGTVGLSTGITSLLSPLGKVVVMLTMYIGRVGPLTMVVALAQRRNARDPIHFPEERVMIG